MDKQQHLGSLVVGIEELATAMSRSEDWLKRNWLKQHEQQGMPRKHPSGWFWPRASIRSWLLNQHGAEPFSSNDNDAPLLTPLEARISDQQQMLHSRYGGN
ncbi:hypothetical protein [Pseudovibrio sp. POLY-S9]|uniref:hypothetical protein n=1 Tax=Pseudovibrio sp. POLY-S9 TaxID=1576596 RepID=UPI00070BF7F1|nr:hypothetical protein [Pseudovibrio sp. POLY-S9]